MIWGLEAQDIRSHKNHNHHHSFLIVLRKHSEVIFSLVSISERSPNTEKARQLGPVKNALD